MAYAACIGAFALRIFRIDYQSIWWDEARSIQIAREGLTGLLNLPGTISGNHPPLYFGLLAGWTRLAGTSELAVRYLSLFFSVLLMPVVYRVSRRWFDENTALAASAVTALASLYVVYSQEARAYALLPLLYLLLIFFVHRLAHDPSSRRAFAALTIVEALLCYSHFVAALVGIVYANITLALAWLQDRRGSLLKAWLGSQMLAGLLFVPWLLNMLRFWSNIAGKMQAYEQMAVRGSPPALGAFFSKTWRFTMFGYEDVPGSRYFQFGVDLLPSVAGLVLIVAALDERKQGLEREVTVLIAGLGSWLLCFLLWQKWPQGNAQSRYTLFASIPFFVVIGRALALAFTRRNALAIGLGSVLTALLLVTFGRGIYAHYFEFDKDDNRAIASYLEKHTSQNDVIMARAYDYTMHYYYDGPASIAMEQRVPVDKQVERLQAITRGKEKLFLMDWDPYREDYVRPFLLERAGQLVAWEDFDRSDVRTYELEHATGPLPDVQPVDVHFGPLSILGAYYESTTTNDNAVTVMLRWQLNETTHRRYKVAVILLDGNNERVGGVDIALRDAAGNGTETWDPGTVEEEFYVVPVPVGALPNQPYRLIVSVYDADTMKHLSLDDDGSMFELGSVDLVPGEHYHDPYQTRDLPWQAINREMENGLRLEKSAVFPQLASPGEPVSVWLRWRALAPLENDVNPTLTIRHQGRVVQSLDGQAFADYPTSQWSAGEVIVERRRFDYPAFPGPFEILFEQTTLGKVDLDAENLHWEPPASMRHETQVAFENLVQLLGYDLEPTGDLKAGASLKVTLYWKALNTPTNVPYTVFVHLWDESDGEINVIGQHDGPPAQGTRPTTEWVRGEVVRDVHTLTVVDDYTGPVSLVVGLYDGQRRVMTGQGDDHAELTTLTITD